MHDKKAKLPLNEDLKVFIAVVRENSFAKAAVNLGVSPAYVSKRISILERTLKAKLFHRGTRNIALTESGDRAYHWAGRILDGLDDFMSDISSTRSDPAGKLRIACSFGFGRNYVAPIISLLIKQYPQLEVQLITTDRVVDLIAEGFDLEVRLGEEGELPKQHIAKKLLNNHRVLCAAPAYLQDKELPETLEDLAKHDCLVIKERDTPFGSWQLQCQQTEYTIGVRGHLSSNSGTIVLQWGLDGHGIFLRSIWDAKRYITQGQLIQVLPDYYQNADIWAIYPTRLANSAKLRVCVEFLEAQLKAISD